MGKAFLSELNEQELSALYPDEILRPLTKKTVRTRRELKEDLAQARRDGFSVDMEGNTEGLSGVGCLIRDAAGRAVAAMSIGVPVHTFTEARKRQLGMLTRLAAGLISYRLGYQEEEVPARDLEDILSWWESQKNTA